MHSVELNYVGACIALYWVCLNWVGLMSRIIKWFGVGIFVVLLLAGIIAAGTLFVFYNSVPKTSGDIILSGLKNSASIVRDENHIPHIEAKTKEDALRLLGLSHASDRLWQMHVTRMAAQGRLSEMFGSATIETDRFLKTLDLVTPSKKSFEILDAESQQMLKAYSDGINAFINRKKDVLEATLPPEFMILGQSPEPWQPWHSLAVLKVMSLTLDSNLGHEIGRLTLAARGFTGGNIADIYPAGPRDVGVTELDLNTLYGWGLGGRKNSSSNKSASLKPVWKQNSTPSNASDFSQLAWPIHQSASNSWAISGKLTNTGKPFLANDPHLGFTSPSTMYLAHISYKENGFTKNVIGGTIAGMPVFLVGRNDRVAWGLTTTKLDSQDLFIEKLDPVTSTKYLTPKGYVDFIEREETIRVKGADDVVFTRRETRNGPVLPLKYKKLKQILPHNSVAALGWVALANDDTTISAALKISTANTVQEVMAFSKHIVSPMQNVIAADMTGNIGLIAAGRVPRRSIANKVQGRAPVPGWIQKYRWLGVLSADQLPQIYNPENNILVAANANWLPRNYDKHITFDWAEDYRQKRAENLMFGRNADHTARSVKQGMGDTYSRAMVAFRDFGTSTLSDAVNINELLFEKIRNWNGQMDKEQIEPLIVVSWFRHANEMVFKDELGDAFDLVKSGSVTRLLKAMGNSRSQNWCNKAATPKLESCVDILSDALDKAVAELEKNYGSDWENWKWGNVHIAVHEHRPFTKVNLLKDLFTLQQPVSGGKYTLLRSTNNVGAQNPYQATQGAAYRALYDFSDLDKSKFIISTGQSGNVMSKHYSDLGDKWAALEYISMSAQKSDYRSKNSKVLKFSPAK